MFKNTSDETKLGLLFIICSFGCLSIIGIVGMISESYQNYKEIKAIESGYVQTIDQESGKVLWVKDAR